MSTRSIIGKLEKDGSVSAIYCHSDGYPDGVGKTLSNYYREEKDVDALLALGDISFLSNDIKDIYSYHRDGREPQLHNRNAPELSLVNFEQYNYFWVNGYWLLMVDDII